MYTESDAERISGLSARYIPFVPDPRHETDDCAGHRCQLGHNKDADITVCYEDGKPVVQSVTFFHLRSFGATWADALTHWRASKPTEAAK